MIDHSELLPEGREIGGFRIDKAIGHGNMGIIYRARSEERRVGKEGRSRWAPDH